MYVGFITVAGTFELTVPLYVVLMSVLGGSRHWLGTSGSAPPPSPPCSTPSSAAARRSWACHRRLILIVAFLWLPDGVHSAIRGLAEAPPPGARTTKSGSSSGRYRLPHSQISERSFLQVRGVT
jgi:branched-chain amino acid transport system permease protein